MIRFHSALAMVLLSVMTGVASAQGGANPPGGGRRGGRGGGRVGVPRSADAPVPRPEMERQVRQAIARAVRKQLNLNDDQMTKLQRANGKFEQQQRQLLREEGETRRNLRAAMEDTTAREQNQPKISQYLDQLVQIQHRRADLLDSEQKELSGFLTPMQRAQFLALRERITRRLQEAQGAPPAGPPPDGQD